MAKEFEIFEGQCPHCGESGCMEQLLVEGTKPFLREHATATLTYEVSEWKTPKPDPHGGFTPEEYADFKREYDATMNAVGGVGALTFKCTKCGKQTYIEKDPYGDWHSNA